MKRQTEDENSILNRIAARAAISKPDHPVRALGLGIGDDAALFRPKAGHHAILTCDWFLEGTHFWRDKHPPDSVGWKCLARAVSDVAAMGGVPRCFLLSLALPKSHTVRWLDAFLGGLWRASRKFQCVLAGGDTTRRREILINVMVVGEVRAGCAVLRSGARVGDILYASGRLGEAELGLQTLRRKKGTARTDDSLTRKHLYPEPRLALGQWLAEKGLATSMIDLSDGLSSDLPRLCAASGVGARLVSAKIPLIQTSANAHKHEFDPLKLALHGGDDYELLFTVPPRRANSVPKAFKSVALTAIGTITEKQTVVLLEENGREQRLVPGGWDPFRKKP